MFEKKLKYEVIMFPWTCAWEAEMGFSKKVSGNTWKMQWELFWETFP